MLFTELFASYETDDSRLRFSDNLNIILFESTLLLSLNYLFNLIVGETTNSWFELILLFVGIKLTLAYVLNGLSI